MYNFSVDKDTYSAIIEWIEILGEYDNIYEKMRVAEIKTRRIQQKAISKTDTIINKHIPYMEIEKKSDTLNNNLDLELIINYIQSDEEDQLQGFEYLYEAINYFVGENNDNSIDFLK